MAKNRLEFGVFPVWDFFEKTIGLDWALALYPPYLGAGVQIESWSKDYSRLIIKMDLTIFNTNYVGKHFGGSLYSMTDPFFMFILMKKLGPAYIVWDKKAEIEFIKPGEGTVRADFYIDDKEIETVKEIVAKERKTDRIYTVEIRDEQNDVVARVKKTLYIRRGPKA